MFDRLVSRPIFAHPDAVMSVDPDTTQVRESRKAHSRAHIIGKDQESGSIRDQATMQGQPIDRGAHGVFADPKMKITPGWGFRLEGIFPIHPGFIGWSQIRRCGRSPVRAPG